MSAWSDVVGQPAVVAQLRAAASAARALAAGARQGPSTSAMTSAWLITGPAGSGRSVAARAFAAALQCTDPREPGCGHCTGCHAVHSGSHPDVVTLRPEGLSISTREVRALVSQAALAPLSGSWRVVLVEDADRLVKNSDDRAANVLLKSVEEPPPRGVFLLCAPSTEDVPATIRSRCRGLTLRTPGQEVVTAVLVSEGVDEVLAAFAARAAQGHVGRARRLARDASARNRRAEVLRMPARLGSTAGCLAAAADLVEAAAEEAASLAGERDALERSELERAHGVEPGARRLPRGVGAAVRELERSQKSRGTRSQRDALDRSLVDLAAWWRDVLTCQLGADVAPVHADAAELVVKVARASTAEQTLRRVDAVIACQQALAANAAPLLAVEAMMLALAAG